jgi:hypothetical protein
MTERKLCEAALKLPPADRAACSQHSREIELSGRPIEVTPRKRILKSTVVRRICDHFSADVDGVLKSRFSLRQTAEPPHQPGANPTIGCWMAK